MTLRTAARVAPWVMTAGLLAMALAAMLIWTRNIGIEEDWNMIDPWLGREPHLLDWLWSQNNEHRLPLGRLIYLGLLWATDDFRSGMVMNQLLLTALSLLLVRVAVRARGGEPRLSDMLFPLALLNLGHWENLLWGWQIQFVSSIFLGGVLLAAIAYAPRPGPRASAAAAAAMALLPMSGANGIAMALGMTPWALYAAFLLRRADRRSASLLAAGAVLALAGTMLYFVGYVHPASAPPPADPRQFYDAAKAYFAMATGSWPRRVPMADGPAALFALLVLLFGALAGLLAFLRSERWADARGLGLAGFIGCNILLGMMIAYSRGALPYHMPARYALFAALPFLAAVLAVQLYAPARPARLFSAFIASLLLLLLPFNIRAGFEWKYWYVTGMQHFEADAARGLPLEVVAERNTGFLLHACEGCLIGYLESLRAAGVAPFATLPPPRAEGEGPTMPGKPPRRRNSSADNGAAS